MEIAMAFVNWNESYSVRINQIDEQHKKLFAIVNNLFEAMKQGKGNDVLGTVLKELENYTRLHLATEENLMKIHNYPRFTAHKMEHDRLVQQVKDLNDQFMNGNAALSIKVSNFLKEWLVNHIQKSDKDYSAYFKKINVI
jgi:hemerythrin